MDNNTVLVCGCRPKRRFDLEAFAIICGWREFENCSIAPRWRAKKLKIEEFSGAGAHLPVRDFKANRPVRFNQSNYWSWCFTDYQILRSAGNTVGKDGHQSRAERKVADRARNEACVRPAADRIGQEENDLAVIETAQLHDRVIAR
jgi:hypothetical protein